MHCGHFQNLFGDVFGGGVRDLNIKILLILRGALVLDEPGQIGLLKIVLQRNFYGLTFGQDLVLEVMHLTVTALQQYQ